MIQSAFGDDLSSFLIRHRKIAAAFTILLTAGLSLFSFRIRFENSVESFISPKDKDLAYYREFKKEFGDDQIIALVFPAGDVFTKQTLREIDLLSKEIEKLPLVRKVKSITEAQDIVGTVEGFEVLPFIEKIPDDHEALKQLRASALANPLYQIDLISLDGAIASLLIESKYLKEEDRYKKIEEEVKRIIAGSPLKDREYYIAGDPVVELQMTRDMWKDLRIFIPMTYLCLIILMFLLFRDIQSVLVLIILISLCVGWLMGLIGALGMTINAVTVGLPSLMLCIASLDGIHILGLYRIHLWKNHDPAVAAELSLSQSFQPCLLTSITTVVGFASMAVSELVPIRQFGILGACATAAAFPICITTMPFLMHFVPVASAREIVGAEQNKLGHFFKGLQKWYFRRTVMIGLLVAMVLMSLVGISRINVETNHLKFLRKHSLVKQSTDYIQNHLGGISPLEITIETPEDDMIKEPRVLRQIDEFQKFLDSLPVVDKSVSPVQFIKEMHQAMNGEDPAFYFLPDSRELIAQYILTYSFSGRDNDLDDFVDYTYRTARIRGRMQQQGSAELRQTLKKIDSFARSNFDPDLKVRITSHSLLQANMVDTLVDGQIKGLGIEFLFMAAIFSLAHGSLLIGLFSLIPNVIPLMMTAALMGFFNISLNAGTAMTMCIAFGLVVDDTVHFFHHARECLRGEKNPALATQKIFEMVGSPVLFTAALLTAGFVILAFGQSLLTVYFGILCAFAILWALICELFITPFMITQIPLFRKALQK